MPRRERCSGLRLTIAVPRKLIVPLLAGRSPEIKLISVVLPAPLGPMTAWSWPRLTSKETASTAASPPKCFDKLRTDKIKSLICHCCVFVTAAAQKNIDQAADAVG